VNNRGNGIEDSLHLIGRGGNPCYKGTEKKGKLHIIGREWLLLPLGDVKGKNPRCLGKGLGGCFLSIQHFKVLETSLHPRPLGVMV